MKRKLIIGVEVFQGIVTDAHVFPDWNKAQDWYKDYTGTVHGSQDELSDNFDQTKLFEVDLTDTIAEGFLNAVNAMEAMLDGRQPRDIRSAVWVAKTARELVKGFKPDTYTIAFTGRLRGAIGAFDHFTETMEAMTEAEARRKLYDKYQDVHNPTVKKENTDA